MNKEIFMRAKNKKIKQSTEVFFNTNKRLLTHEQDVSTSGEVKGITRFNNNYTKHETVQFTYCESIIVHRVSIFMVFMKFSSQQNDFS